MADAKSDKQQIVTGVTVATFVLKDGGFAVVRQGEPVPDNIADGQLEHKRKAGAFGDPPAQDWAALAALGTVPAPDNAAGRAEAADQAVEAATAPVAPEAPSA